MTSRLTEWKFAAADEGEHQVLVYAAWASRVRSQHRRAAAERRRQRVRRRRQLALVPGVAGAAILVAWITQPMPYTDLWIGVIGAVLVMVAFVAWGDRDVS